MTTDKPDVTADTAKSSEDLDCCRRLRATKAVLADRERELLDLKGPCRTGGCRLHYAHSGPCDITEGATR